MNTWRNIALISIATLATFIFYFFYPNIFGSRSHRSKTVILDGNPIGPPPVSLRCYSRLANKGRAKFEYIGRTFMPNNTKTGEYLQIIVEVIDLANNRNLDNNEFSVDITYQGLSNPKQESSILGPTNFQRIIELESNEYYDNGNFAESRYTINLEHDLNSNSNKEYQISFYHDHGGSDHNIRDFTYYSCPRIIDYVKEDDITRKLLDEGIDDLFGNDTDTPIGVIIEKDRLFLFNKNNPVAVPVDVSETE